MPYYCKKCGAVVTGKFCSCCGTKARSGLEEFRLAERRFNREFSEKKCREAKMNGGPPYPKHIASLAYLVAYSEYVPARLVNVCDFDRFDGVIWDGFEEAKEGCERIYQSIASAILHEIERLSSTEE